MNAPLPWAALLPADGLAHGLPGALLQLAQHMHHGVLLLDAERRITWVNPAFTRASGYSLDEAIGHNPGQLRGSIDADSPAVRHMRRVLYAGQAYRGVISAQARNGRRYWLDVEVHPLGAGAGFIAIEVELSASQAAAERFRLMFAGTAAGLVLVDASGQIIDSNPAAERLLGALADGAVRGAPSSAEHWQTLDLDGQPLAEDQRPTAITLRTGEPVHDRVLSLRGRDGQRRWLSFTTQSVPGDDHERWVVSSFIDVTDRVEGARRTQASWEAAQATLAGTRMGLWRSNLETNELLLDAHCARMLGFDPAATPAQHMQAWMGTIHADDRAHVWAAVQAHAEGRQSYSMVEYRLLQPGGGFIWVRGRTHSAPTAVGTPHLLSGTVEDITEQRRAEREARHQVALFEALFERAPFGIQLLDLQTQQVVRCNPAMETITGHSRRVLLETPASRRATPEAQRRRERWRRELIEGGSTGPHEFDVLHVDGHWRHLVMSGVRVNDAEGHPFAWGLIQDVTQRKQMERQLLAAAREDRLTGLPNRVAMGERLEALIARCAGEPGFGFALMFLDFDRFKLVNDTLGHATGDELLRAIALRLQAQMPADADWMVARFGGDEFVLAAPGIRDVAAAAELATQLAAAMAPAFSVRGHDLHSSASIGVALSDGDRHGPEALLRQADTAMYEAKRMGRGRAVVFDEQMHSRLTRAVQIENGLRHAIEREELQVVYQPIVDLETGQLTSAEALMRWTHPLLGAVSPAEFVPIAEESGHVVALGEWILRQACLQWVRWQREDAANAPRSVSVNLSRVQLLLGAALVETVHAVLRDSGMPPGALQLEVTEREVMSDPGATSLLLHQLRAAGIRLAMDDFGTGSSSLGCLRDYPFDTIKIDKSFVADLCRDPQALALAHATVNVIENLGMASVAEGVEEPSDVAALQSLGCRYGQGWLFGRPMPGDALLAAMAANADAATRAPGATGSVGS